MKRINKQIPELNNVAKSVLTSLFLDQIVRLNSIRNGAALGQQLEIKALQTKLLLFINSNPYSFFTINVLDTFDNKKNIKLGLRMKNFKYFNKQGNKPNEYHIFISKQWNNYTIYTESIDGKHILIK